MTTAALLALFAGVLAWPVPRLLAAARWPHRYPRAAILLWQAIGLAGGVSALLAAVAFTVSPLAASTPSAIIDHLTNVAAGEPLAGLRWINLVGLALATALAGRLFGVLGASTAATLRERHRHRHLVDLAGRRHRRHDTHDPTGHLFSPAGGLPTTEPFSPTGHHDHLVPGDRLPPEQPVSGLTYPSPVTSGHPTTGGENNGPIPDESVMIRAVTSCCLCEHRDRAGIRLRILDHPIAVAYCVPGVRHARVVVSRGLLNTLAADELDAVLAHEAAHVAGRHDLVIQPFVAWERTFPFLGPAREATAAVSLLVEMLADDAAGRQTSRPALARALARIGVTRAPVPAGALSILGANGALGANGTLADAAGIRTAGAGGTAATHGHGREGGHEGPVGVGPSRGITNPVISRIARLLDPPAVHWWQALVAYLGAAAVLATPPLIILIG